MEEQENKYAELRRLYEDDLSRWTWFVKLDDIAKNILLTEIAATTSRVYYEGWHEGFGDAKKIYDQTNAPHQHLKNDLNTLKSYFQ